MDFNNRKMKNHPPSPGARESTAQHPPQQMPVPAHSAHYTLVAVTENV